MSPIDTGLVWLRRDLRLHDHAAIALALAHCRQLQLAFVFDTAILAPLPRAELGRDTKLGAADELVAIAGAELDLARWLAATD